MSEKHTEGPWMIQELGGHAGYPDWKDYAVRQAKTNVHLAAVGNVDRYYERNNEANARLISAAPDLLAACQAFLRAPSPGSNGPGSVTIEVQTYNLNAAREAIAKATGAMAVAS